MLTTYNIKKSFVIIFTIFLLLNVLCILASAEKKTDVIPQTRGVLSEQKFGIFERLKDFIKNRKEAIPLHIVTKYNDVEKVTKVKFLRPTTIDVDGDGDKDVRVRIFRLPSIDFHPLSLAVKTVLIVSRLPGMNNIKNDFFEIYLEYCPKIITKFFYLTQAIDIVRIGYQSPAGGEVPKTFILTDKTAPHLLYPKLKTSHKISVNPGSATGKYPLNLIFSLIDSENDSFAFSYNELKTVVNYDRAVKIKGITFARSKEKVLDREQTLEITRDAKPSNVTFYYNRFIDYSRGSSMDENSSSILTIEDLPKSIEIKFLLAKNGYIEINTHDDNMGHCKGSIDNNAIIFGFIPVEQTHMRISWENRTLKSYFIFNLSIDVKNSIELKDFYFIVNNFYQNYYQEYTFEDSSIQFNASRLVLDIDSGGKIYNYTTIYFLLPLMPGILSAESIEWHTENLQIEAYDITLDVRYLQNVSGSNSSESTYRNFHTQIYAKYLELRYGSSNFSLDRLTGILHYSGKGNVNIEGFAFFIKDFEYETGDVGKIDYIFDIEASFSNLSYYLSSSAEILLGKTPSISFYGNGFLTIADLFYKNSYNGTLRIDLVQIFGNFSANILRGSGTPSLFNGTGDGSIVIKNLSSFTSYNYYDYDMIFSFSYLNLSSDPLSVLHYNWGFDSSDVQNLSIDFLGGSVEITDVYYRKYDANSTFKIVSIGSITLLGDFSVDIKSQTMTEYNGSYTSSIVGYGNLEIDNLYIYTKYTYDEFYEDELLFSHLSITSLPLRVTSFIINSHSNDSYLSSIFIENGLANITDLDEETKYKGVTTRKIHVDSIKISGNFLFENEEGNNLLNLGASGEGNLEIKNFYVLNSYFYSYYGYDTEFSFSYLNLSSDPLSVLDSWLRFDSSNIENISVYLNGGSMRLTDLLSRTYNQTTTYRTGAVDFIDVSKNLLLNIKLDISESSSSSLISIDGDGHLEIRNILYEEDAIYHEIDSINKSGDSSFSLFIPGDGSVNRQSVYDFNHIDGVIEISGVRSSNVYMDALEYLYIDGNGDLKIERWQDTDTSDYHTYLESQNGITLDLFSFELDNGIKYDIERQGTMQGHIGPGFVHFGVDLNGDGDGFVFIDSSEIEFDDLSFTFKSSILQKGLSCTPNIQPFDADSFLLQWDSFTLNNQDQTTIPFNWYKTGNLLNFDIGILNGNNYYQLWPLDDLNSENQELESQELESTENMYNNNGMQPLEAGPSKPQKPVGPYGGVVIGRIVEGNNYTFSSLNNDPNQLISYKWDWGDGTTSDWSVYLPSGVGVTGTHTWNQIGTYSIKVKAKNVNDEESSWSNPFTITVRIKLTDDEQNNQNYEVVEQSQNYNQGQPTNT